MVSFPYRRCSGDQIKENEMGGACGTYGGEEISYQFLVGKTEGNRSLGRPWRSWKNNNNKINLKDVGWKDVE